MACVATAILLFGTSQAQTLDTWLDLLAGGSAAEVEAALSAGGDPNAALEYGWRALSVAAAMNPDPEVIRVLQAAGADLETRVHILGQAYTPLHLAAASNPNPQVLSALITAGADPHARTTSGSSLLHLAARWNPYILITDLIHGEMTVQGDSLDERILTLTNPLPTTIQPVAAGLYLPDLGFSVSLKIIATDPGKRHLTLERAPPFPPDLDSLTISHRLDPDWAPIATGDTKRELLRKLISEGCDVNARDNYGFTPLMEAARYSDGYETATLLLAAGADPLARSTYGSTALHVAAINREADPRIVELLVSAGVNVDAHNAAGNTPLIEAVEFGSPGMIGALLDAGADPRQSPSTTRFGREITIMELARSNAALYRAPQILHPVYWRLNDLQFE